MSSRRFQVQDAELAVENLGALPKTVASQIIRKISRLENGLQANIKRLREADFGYRLRMRDYRILFDVQHDRIVIQKIGHRKDVYELRIDPDGNRNMSSNESPSCAKSWRT